MMQDDQKKLLPALIDMVEYGGDWSLYLEAIYKYYLNDVVNAKLTFKGLMIQHKFIPLYNNKGFGFWHAISEGDTEETRTPDLRRCERIRWIPWVIHQAKDGSNNSVMWWKNKRRIDTHIVFLYEKESYVVILAERSDYYLFKTAYCASARRLQKLIQERDQFWRGQKD